MTAMSSVGIASDLKLQCKDHPVELWCDCRSQYMQMREESDHLFSTVLDEGFLSPDPIDFLLPLVPTKDYWAPIRLKSAGRSISASNPNDPAEVYGVISRGQGYIDIRTLWFDALNDELLIDGEPSKPDGPLLLKCGGNHRWKAARTAQMIDGQTDALAYNLSIKLYGKCPVCNREENYDDLIPEAEPRAESAWQKHARHEYDPSSDSGY